jgi:hypothetical protein
VHLLLEAVEDNDFVAELDQGANEVRADETGTAGDECSHRFGEITPAGSGGS